jgi:hypothetical protein
VLGQRLGCSTVALQGFEPLPYLCHFHRIAGIHGIGAQQLALARQCLLVFPFLHPLGLAPLRQTGQRQALQLLLMGFRLDRQLALLFRFSCSRKASSS